MTNKQRQTIITAARYYREKGWNVLPTYNFTKAPFDVRVKWDAYKQAPLTDEEFEKYFSDSQLSGVGLVCGKSSGVIVIDEDSYKDQSRTFDVYTPLVSNSARGGKHLFFRYTDELSKSIGEKEGLGFRSNGNFTVLPPSLTTHGKYEWASKNKVDITNLPTLKREQVLKYYPKHNERINLAEKINVPLGEQHIALREATNSILNKYPESQWEAEAYPLIRSIAETYQPPHPHDRVEKMIRDCSDFVRNNPKENTATSHQSSTRGEKVSKPLTLSEVTRRRNQDRKLEVGAPKTGYPELDELVKGFLPKHFWTITGETNVGKTAFACNLAEYVRRQKRKVLYVALEPEYKVSDYIASVRHNKTFESVTDSDMEQDDGFIDIFTLSEVPTYHDLIASLRSQATAYDLIIIDHIGYFCRSSEDKSFIVEQSQTIRDLVGISKELHTCVIAIAHPRKPSSNQQNRILNMYDISGTAAFAQDSTEVLVLWRPAVDQSDPKCVELSNEGLLLVQKTKAGKNGSVRIKFENNKAVIISPQQEIYTEQPVIRKAYRDTTDIDESERVYG